MVLGLAGAAVFSALQAHRARVERDRAEKVKGFLFAVLGAPSPGAEGRDVRVLDVLAEARTRAERELRDDPATRAEVLLTLGTTYYDLSQYAESEPLLRAALADARASSGEASLATGNALKALGELCNYTSRLPEAAELAGSAAAIFRRHLPGSRPQLMRALNALASVRIHQGAHHAATPLLEEAMRLGREIGRPAHSDTLVVMGDLAICYDMMGRRSEARRMVEQVIAEMRHVPELRENLTTILSNYSEYLIESGELPAAQAAAQESYDRRVALFGARSQSSGIGLARVAWVQYQRADYAAAERSARESLQVLREASPPLARELNFPLRSLSFSLLKLGRPAEAEPLLAELCEVIERHMASNHRLVEQARQALAEARAAR